MPRISKKVCMVGPFAVGKTSLVRRFVESIFSDKYHTTIGVKISKKVIDLDEAQMQLMLWDIEGVDVFTDLRPSYLRGAAGVMIAVDGTRPATFKQIDRLIELVNQQLPDVPKVLLVNKFDLKSEWKLEEQALEEYASRGIPVFRTSAKTGEAVEEAFETLAKSIV
ncbi:MAG: GTP-binding protein [Oleiphilus sp.]|nr:MAG: GTP-binding protein [Oleiphilus sp.]